MEGQRELTALVGRIERLERGNRRYRWMLGVAIVLGLIIGPVVAVNAGDEGTTRFDTVSVKRLAVMDGNNRVRALMGTKDDGKSYLSLFDVNNKVRASLAVTKTNNPMLSLYDENQKVRATMTYMEGKGSHVILFDENQRAVHQWPRP